MQRQKRNSGAGLGVFAVFIALVLIMGPWVLPIFGPEIPLLSQIVLMGFGVVLLIVGVVIFVFTSLYHKTTTDKALIRTGRGESKVIIDGGCVVIPMVHELAEVSLQSIRFVVDRTGQAALIVGNKLRVDIIAEFYIRVMKDETDIKNAATSVGPRINEYEVLNEFLLDKLTNALRTVAAKQTLEELHANRDGFTAAVREYLTDDLKHNGLTLESVTISRLDQTPVGALRPDDNAFDAEGLTTITEITQRMRVARNELTRKADQVVKEQDVTANQAIYSQEVSQANAENDRNLKIAQSKAETDAKANAIRAEQERVAELARVATEQAVQVAEVGRGQAIQVANQQREQAEAVARVAREQAEQVAQQEKDRAVAEARKSLAEAEALQAAAEAEAEKQRQAVRTVEVTSTAQRDADQKVIAARAQAEQQRLNQNVEVDVQAYKTKQLAEAGLAAASQEAQAMTTRAEAEKQAAVLRAQGLEAEQLVPVQVKSQEVDVQRKEVEVLDERLSTQDRHAAIARDMEIALAAINADKEVRIEQAKAMGVALSKTNMTVWGTPDQVEKITNSFMMGQSVSHGVNGALAALSPELRAMVESLGAAGISQLLSKMSSNGVDEEDKQLTGASSS